MYEIISMSTFCRQTGRRGRRRTLEYFNSLAAEDLISFSRVCAVYTIALRSPPLYMPKQPKNILRDKDRYYHLFE